MYAPLLMASVSLRSVSGFFRRGTDSCAITHVAERALSGPMPSDEHAVQGVPPPRRPVGT
jgi:hypothetical protein